MRNIKIYKTEPITGTKDAPNHIVNEPNEGKISSSYKYLWNGSHTT